jgi:pimeloyl-ACP methyl ester carboxylesterase
MAEHVRDLRALVRSLGAEPAHLVGHSYGAFLCLVLAMEHPAAVRSLVLAEPPALTLFVSNDPTPRELLKLALTRPRTAAAIVRFGATGVIPSVRAFRAGDARRGARIFGDAVFGPGGYASLNEDRRAQVYDNLSNVSAELLGPGLLPLPPQAVAEMSLPTLLVTGERSIGLFHRLTDRLDELLPRSERAEIPDASHMMHQDNAPVFNHAVRTFLEARGRQPAPYILAARD